MVLKEIENIFNIEKKILIKKMSFIRKNYLDIKFFEKISTKRNKIIYINNNICIFFLNKKELISFDIFLKKKYFLYSKIFLKEKKIVIENFKFEEGNKKLSNILKIIYEDYSKKIKGYLIKYKKKIKELSRNKNIINEKNKKIIFIYKKFLIEGQNYFNSKLKSFL
ncbi:hypothetical protein C9I84_110 [Candidatus Vidania fulgoroideae]|uniref:Uncharacterized protein n=1 Tax=Candidatus Vidania fulgoroideorum TaxID=881286 RepID=A0A346E0J3_9PROT|nr:hypothetical protein C9I84_110 [Candidatus Vidania fulgoroideae]WDI79447.1 hypothetical protein ONB79_00275 [Candidatus Vidania fulgoroideae]WDR79195.1 hypothetical protein ONB65_00570 [Candidatus Vidania fulgoroideae]